MANIPAWCDFARSEMLCTGSSSNCSASHTCKWPGENHPTAVIFSDRLIQTGMVTMTSLCRHPSPLTVLVFTRFTKDYEPLPTRYLQCRVLTLSLSDALEHLTRIGWKPETICDPPGSSRLGKASESTLIGTLSWDKDYKHASCANHLREHTRISCPLPLRLLNTCYC